MDFKLLVVCFGKYLNIYNIHNIVFLQTTLLLYNIIYLLCILYLVIGVNTASASYGNYLYGAGPYGYKTLGNIYENDYYPYGNINLDNPLVRYIYTKLLAKKLQRAAENTDFGRCLFI